jgi:hypothetical protein
MVAYGAEGVPLPLTLLPVVATNTPNCDERMHGSDVFEGTSVSGRQSPLQV